MGNRNNRKKRKSIDEEHVRALADGIFARRILTSRHLFILSEGDEDHYIALMSHVFPTDQIFDAIKDHENMTLSDFFNNHLWYCHLKEDLDTAKPLPVAEKTHVIFGEPLEMLDKILKAEYSQHLN